MFKRFFRLIAGLITTLRTLVSLVILGFIIAVVADGFSDPVPPIADSGALSPPWQGERRDAVALGRGKPRSRPGIRCCAAMRSER